MNDSPLTEQQLTDIEALASRAADDPFFVSDCEGSLQVWRERALTHVRRDDDGVISMYSFPSSYRPTDQIMEIDLDTWDPGEDATDDQRRQDINDLVDSRAAVGVLLAEIERLRARTAMTRALSLLEAADFLRDAHFRDGLSVQEIGTALRHTADEADPMVGSLARDGFGLDEIADILSKPAAAPAAVETGE